jgi:hypothetical protein
MMHTPTATRCMPTMILRADSAARRTSAIRNMLFHGTAQREGSSALSTFPHRAGPNLL